MISKSSLLAEAQDYIRGSRMILGALSLMLVIAGLMNYLNVMVTNIWSRHKEFAVLHSIGMTHRQIRRMLRMEGMYYCLLTAGLMLTAGSGILWLVKVYMGFKVEYFAFTYPWMLSAVMILALAGICAGIPVLAYRNNEKHITFLRGK